MERLSAIPGIEELLNTSRSPDSETYHEASRKLHTLADSLLSAYSRTDLMAARHHYNALHLAEYWKIIWEMLEGGINQGFITENFPLVNAKLNPDTKQITLSACTPDQFASGFVNFNLDTMAVIARETTTPKNLVPTPRQLMGSLLGKLVLLKHEYIDFFTVYYNLYLSQQRAAQSSIWDTYCIHVFLDTFLYFDGTRPQFRSHFDAIFFNDNLYELKTYLEYHHSAGSPLEISDVQEFLSRQTTHNLKLSMQIPLHETRVLNTHKELLAFNPETGVVELQNIPHDLLESTQTEIHEHGLIKIDGCPFAKTKGVNGNALVEVYDYFDTLFLAVLSSSWEFRALFSKA